MSSRPTPKTYTYRVPIDDRRAIRKIHLLDCLDTDYWITKLNKRRHVPTVGSGRHFAHVFYQSEEHFDWDRQELVGGTIPGLGKYRYSLEWQPYPDESLLEMRNANGGGTRIRGERFVGTSDPRLPDYVPIDTTVPWTPTEITAMYDGESVPDRLHYSTDPPTIPAADARRQLTEELRWAEQDGLDEIEAALRAFEDECSHTHVVTTGATYGPVAYCEDCGRDFHRDEFEYAVEHDELRVVGEV